MRTVLIAIAIIGMAALGAVAYRGGIVFAAKPDEAGEPPMKPPVIADTSTAPDVVPRPDPVPARPREPARARPISPSIVAIPPVDPVELERVAPREPLTRLALALPPERPALLRLDRPVATAAGVFSSGDFEVTLSDIEPPSADEICTDAAGRDWPCGARARTAFRSYLRGRSVECRIDPKAPTGKVIAPCTLAGRDIALWLVENGWARTEASTYEDAAEAARKAGKGLFAAAPAWSR